MSSQAELCMKLFRAYIDTLDNTQEVERYATARWYAEEVYDGFTEWLRTGKWLTQDTEQKSAPPQTG